jgi:hypothetical protein
LSALLLVARDYSSLDRVPATGFIQNLQYYEKYPSNVRTIGEQLRTIGEQLRTIGKQLRTIGELRKCNVRTIGEQLWNHLS